MENGELKIMNKNKYIESKYFELSLSKIVFASTNDVEYPYVIIRLSDNKTFIVNPDLILNVNEEKQTFVLRIKLFNMNGEASKMNVRTEDGGEELILNTEIVNTFKDYEIENYRKVFNINRLKQLIN